MSLFSFLKKLYEKKSITSTDASTYPSGFLGYNFGADGTPLNEFTALSVSTVLQCVSVLENGISQVPFYLARKKGDNVYKTEDHYLNKLITRKPNKWQTSIEFRQTLMFWLCLSGEVAVWIVRSRGKIVYLIPFGKGSYSTTVNYVNGWAEKTYILQKDSGETVSVPEKDIWLLKWHSFSTQFTLPQKYLISQSLRIALGQNSKTLQGVSNGEKVPGILHAKLHISKDQFLEVKEQWEEQTQGANYGKTPVLGNDLEFQNIGQTNSDSQFLENKQFQISEICRCFNVSPFMVFHYIGNTTYSSAEQFMLQHLVHSISPWYAAIEESAACNLLTEEELDQGYYFMFNDNALLRSDTKARGEFYRVMVNAGIMTPNEARKKEDLPPMEGGDQLYVQGATVPLKDAGKWNAAKMPSSSSDTKKPTTNTSTSSSSTSNSNASSSNASSSNSNGGKGNA